MTKNYDYDDYLKSVMDWESEITSNSKLIRSNELKADYIRSNLMTQPIFDPDTKEFLGSVGKKSNGSTFVHPTDCKCINCADEFWKQRQRDVITRRKSAKEITDSSTYEHLQTIMSEHHKQIEKLKNRIDGQNEVIRTLQKPQLETHLKPTNFGLVENGSDRVLYELELLNNQKQNFHRDRMIATKRTVIAMPFLLGSSALAFFSLWVIAAPLFAVAVVLLGAAWSVMQPISYLDDVNEKIAEQHYLQNKILTAQYKKDLGI